MTQSANALRGLTSVFVVVQPINDDIGRDGLFVAHVRSVVESSLPQAGIATVAKEPQQKDGFANLVITIDTIKQQMRLSIHREC